MKIYNRDGWVNWEYLLNLERSFLMVVGARGIGKTYGVFRYLIGQGKPFVYLRRLQTQIDMCSSESGNPFRKLNTDLGLNIVPTNKGKIVEFRHDDKDGDLVCVACSLSTVATIRGFDFSGYDYIVFDECVPMTTEKPIKDEFNAFLNLYETVNRNRELSGDKAVMCVMLGNANQLINPYYTGWKFTKTALKMIKGRQMVYTTPDQTRTMILLFDSPISAKKKETALYQNASDDFMSMALDNAFRTDETKIGSKPLQEYNHVVSVGEIGIYRHKSTGDYYVSSVKSIPYYDDFGINLKLFRNEFFYLEAIYMIRRNFIFESFENEILFREYMKLV